MNSAHMSPGDPLHDHLELNGGTSIFQPIPIKDLETDSVMTSFFLFPVEVQEWQVIKMEAFSLRLER